MKIVRSLDQSDTKKIDRLIDLEPELIEMLEEHKARKDASKIVNKFIISAVVIVCVVLIAMFLPSGVA